jgi:gamma-glutamyl hercynylcysteine S-oxide synthase
LISASPLCNIADVIDQRVSCRESLLALAETLSEVEYARQAHADFSPIGWHLGHIAYTEALWLLERYSQHRESLPPQYQKWQRLFAADGLAKMDRQNLPSWPEVSDYLETVRQEVDLLLVSEPVPPRLVNWLLQHESQHFETIQMVLALHRWSQAPLGSNSAPEPTPQLLIPAGEFWMGNDEAAIDNEGPRHCRTLPAYRIDEYPVTVAQYREFILAGGYREQCWWSVAGWQWLQSHPVDRPLYWTADDCQPVCGLSWYEADAYARFVGKRLPTEAEWEKAAPLLGQVGRVWEWTMTTFAPYPNFSPYPYVGYSQAYFDDAHFVLRGSSNVTEAAVRRLTFRNWYYPNVRQVFAGCRCVSSL